MATGALAAGGGEVAPSMEEEASSSPPDRRLLCPFPPPPPPPLHLHQALHKVLGVSSRLLSIFISTAIDPLPNETPKADHASPSSSLFLPLCSSFLDTTAVLLSITLCGDGLKKKSLARRIEWRA